MEAFEIQLWIWMAVNTTAAICGYIAESRRFNPRVVGVCWSGAAGVSLGGAVGAATHSFIAEFSNWILRQDNVPFWIQTLCVPFATHDIETVYAPSVGMIAGLGVALALCYSRIKKEAS